ncbi:unnamed protein product [Peronospora destructor]|uniref:Uncharacterized protein n=1 Tax=Peronospora destructor TaxID=86335 RepID=A0AAV0TJB8_9STRA|nr:unnamed protein product [Peronospora destructor]
MHANSATVSLRDTLDDEATAQCNALASHREDAAILAADLEKCYVQLGAREQKAIPTKQKNKTKKENELEEMKEEPVVMLTDLLLSKLSEDSSALREIVFQVFFSLLLLLNDACLTTITNVLQPTAVAEVLLLARGQGVCLYCVW